MDRLLEMLRRNAVVNIKKPEKGRQQSSWDWDRDMAVLRALSSGAPNENIVQNHFNTTLLKVFQYLNDRCKHIFIP